MPNIEQPSEVTREEPTKDIGDGFENEKEAPATREQLREEYFNLDGKTEELSMEEILTEPELGGELAAFCDKYDALPSSDRVGLLLTDSGNPEKFLEFYSKASKASVHEYKTSLGLSAKAGFVEVSQESPTAPEVLFEVMVSEKLSELIPTPEKAPEGVLVFERPGLRYASERTGEDLGNPYRLYAVEIGTQDPERGYVFVMPQEGEMLELSPATSLGTRLIRWNRPLEEGKQEILEFNYDPNSDLVKLERDGETVLDPKTVNKEFAAFRDRLLEYRPNPVSAEEFAQKWVQRVEAMTPEERTKFLTGLIDQIATRGSDQANRK